MSRAAKDAREQLGFEAVRLRGDTDFSLTRYFDEWTEAGIEFNFGMDAHPTSKSEHSTADVVYENNARCNQENLSYMPHGAPSG